MFVELDERELMKHDGGGMLLTAWDLCHAIEKYIFSTMRRKRKQELYEGRKIMELALQFENLNCEELCAIDGGNKAQDVGYQVGKYIGITATFILKLMGY